MIRNSCWVGLTPNTKLLFSPICIIIASFWVYWRFTHNSSVNGFIFFSLNHLFFLLFTYISLSTMLMQYCYGQFLPQLSLNSIGEPSFKSPQKVSICGIRPSLVKISPEFSWFPRSSIMQPLPSSNLQ